MKPAVFRTFSEFVTISTERSVHCRTRGGEWWGCIAATPHVYMVRSSVKASTIGANKQPVNLSLSNRLDFAGWPVNAEPFQSTIERYMWHLRFSAKTAVDWMFTRPGFTPVSELLTQMDVQSISRLAFPPLQKACRNWLTGLPNTTVTMFAWNPPVSSGYRCSISLKIFAHMSTHIRSI